MGTSNFYRKNARSIYAVLMDYEDDVFDDEGNETGEKEMKQCDSWDVDYLKEYVIELATAKATELGYKEGIFTEKDPYDNRNFNSGIITSLRYDKVFAGIDIEFEIQLLYRIGYYEGACLDWITRVHVINTEYIDNEADDVTDDLDHLAYYSDLSIGFLKMQSKNIQRFINQKREEMIDAVEEIFTKVSTPLEVIGIFSSGETIYRNKKQ